MCDSIIFILIWEGLLYLAGCALYAFSTTKFNYLAVLLSPAVKFGNCNLATESQNPCGSTEDWTRYYTFKRPESYHKTKSGYSLLGVFYRHIRNKKSAKTYVFSHRINIISLCYCVKTISLSSKHFTSLRNILEI